MEDTNFLSVLLSLKYADGKLDGWFARRLRDTCFAGKLVCVSPSVFLCVPIFWDQCCQKLWQHQPRNGCLPNCHWQLHPIMMLIYFPCIIVIYLTSSQIIIRIFMIVTVAPWKLIDVCSIQPPKKIDKIEKQLSSIDIQMVSIRVELFDLSIFVGLHLGSQCKVASLASSLRHMEAIGRLI